MFLTVIPFIASPILYLPFNLVERTLPINFYFHVNIIQEQFSVTFKLLFIFIGLCSELFMYWF